MRRNAFQWSNARIHMRRAREKGASQRFYWCVIRSRRLKKQCYVHIHTHNATRCDAWYHGNAQYVAMDACVGIDDQQFVRMRSTQSTTYVRRHFRLCIHSCLCCILVARRLFCCDRIHCQFFFSSFHCYVYRLKQQKELS